MDLPESSTCFENAFEAARAKTSDCYIATSETLSAAMMKLTSACSGSQLNDEEQEVLKDFVEAAGPNLQKLDQACINKLSHALIQLDDKGLDNLARIGNG